MCVVSMIMDHYDDSWRRRIDEHTKWIVVPAPQPIVTPEEIAEFKRLLERAREYDKRNNEPDCELEEKRQALKKLAQELGIEIAFV